jgi:hypothetical protein
VLQQRFPDLEIVAISAEQSDGLAELRAALERWLYQTEELPRENAVEAAEVVAAE